GISPITSGKYVGCAVSKSIDHARTSSAGEIVELCFRPIKIPCVIQRSNSLDELLERSMREQLRNMRRAQETVLRNVLHDGDIVIGQSYPGATSAKEALPALADRWLIHAPHSGTA